MTEMWNYYRDLIEQVEEKWADFETKNKCKDNIKMILK